MFQVSKLPFVFFLCFYLVFNCALHSQESSNYSLLWKIEADTLAKPSYLFGTMHVDDAKVFNFSDAVMPAIENSDFFALEVEPDELMRIYSAKTYSIEAHEFYKELLPEAYYNILDARFNEMYGMSLEESGISNPDEVLTWITPDPDKSDDKSTFVDMYLYGIAETLQRTIVGLEEPETQVNYFDNMSRESQIEYVKSFLDYEIEDLNFQREEMATIYSTGDLSKIESYILSQNFSYDDMVDRNYVMRNSILDYMEQGSIFAAVGAAHLPGETGLINLFKEQGFKVSVEKATFTGIADSYTIDDSKKIWHTFVDDTLNFKVKTPKAPNLNDNFDDFTIYGYNDMVNSTSYLFMGYKTGYKFSDEQQPTLMNSLIENVIKKRGATNIEIDSIQEADRLIYNVISDIDSTNKLKAQFILKNNCIYYFSAEGKTIDSPSIAKFFDSIDVIGIEKEEIENPEWRSITYDKGKFKISVPVEPKDISRTSPNPLDPESEPYMLNLFMSTDLVNDNNYLYRYNDQPVGYYSLGPDAIFADTESTFGEKATMVSEPKEISINGHAGREFEFLIQGKYHSVARVYVRGNRTYLLLKQKLNSKDKATTNDPFFNDFELLDYSNTSTNYTSLDNEAIKIDMFENVKSSLDTLGYEDLYVKDSNDHYSVNPETGGVYHVSYCNLKDYFRAPSLKTIYDEYKENLIEWNDTIIGESYVVKGVDSTLNFTVKGKNDLNLPELKHYSVLIKESRLIITEALITEEEKDYGVLDHFLNSLVIKPNPVTINLFDPKGELILSNLKSKDSITYTNALGAFNYYEFLDQELPMMHAALYDSYPSDSDNMVQKTIIDEFSIINNEETTSVLKEFYIKSKNNEVKALILGTLPDLESKERLEVYKELISSGELPYGDHDYNYSILRPFRDSLSFTINNSDLFYSFLPKKELRSNIIDITLNIASNDSITLNRFSNGYSELFRFMEYDWNTYNAKSEDFNEYYDIIFSYVDFLNSITFSNKTIDKITQDILDSDKGDWLRLRTLQARLNLDLKLNDKTFNRYIEDYYSRFELMEALKEKGQFNKVPKTYLKDIEFGKLSLFNYVVDDSSIPKELKHLGTIKGGDSSYAVYSIIYEEYIYLGIADISTPVLEQESFEQFRSYSDFADMETDWKSQVRDYIKTLEENLD